MSDLERNADLPPEGTTTPASPPVPAAAPRRSRTGLFFLGALSGCLLVVVFVSVLAVIAALARSDSGELSLSGGKVAVIAVEGEILEARDTVEALHRYADNALVRGIVIRINSPGGAIAPSQEIYEAIRNTRAESGKPIVASLDSVAASGGFYIASACDRIVANPGSITGSIGVIMQWVEMRDLLAWAKLKPETITSGALKATGSPFQELSEGERQYLQSIVSQLHSQFVRAVAEGRKGKITAAEVSRLADGRVFTGEQALGLKLVDQLGNLDDAVLAAGKLAGVRGRPGTIYPRRHRPGLLEILSSGDTATSIDRILSQRSPRFLFRW